MKRNIMRVTLDRCKSRLSAYQADRLERLVNFSIEEQGVFYDNQIVKAVEVESLETMDKFMEMYLNEFITEPSVFLDTARGLPQLGGELLSWPDVEFDFDSDRVYYWVADDDTDIEGEVYVKDLVDLVDLISKEL